MMKQIYIIIFLLLISIIPLFANEYEFIGSESVTANVNSITNITVGARGIYFLSNESQTLKIKWPNTTDWQTVNFSVSDPETTFEHGDIISIQAVGTTHNVFVGIYRRK